MSFARLGCGSCGAERERGVGFLAAVCAAVDEAGNCISYLPEYTGAVAAPTTTSSWLQNLISGGVKTVEDIFKAQNVTRGVYTATGPGGQQVTYVQPEGTSQNVFAATQTGVSGGVTATGTPNLGMIVIGGAALLLVFMLARKR